jgi:tetratricopeptide (TPR) repeat protein
MATRGLAVLLALLLAAAPTTTAWAQTRDKKAAAGHFQSGRQLFEQGRWADALAEFQAGYEAYPLNGFLVNIGQCYRKLERLEEARDTWQKFLESSAGDRTLRAEVDEALGEVRAEIDKRSQEDARRRADEESKRRALAESAARERQADLSLHSSSAAVSSSATAVSTAAPQRKKSRWWVWTIVGVVAAGAVASAVTVGVIYGQPQQPQPGSLGLLDGRR